MENFKVLGKSNFCKTEWNVDNLTLHYPNEAARHKLLDVVGDLALLEQNSEEKFIANNRGHYVKYFNLLKKWQNWLKLNNVIMCQVYDLNQRALMDIHKIMSVLPHQPPFLLIDRIIEMTDTYVVGMEIYHEWKFLCWAFPVHRYAWCFDCRAMAQTGGILHISTIT